MAKELFDAGKQIADDVDHLIQRVERASNLSSRLVKSPWVLVAGAVAAGAVLLRVSMRKG